MGISISVDEVHKAIEILKNVQDLWRKDIVTDLILGLVMYNVKKMRGGYK